MTYVSLTLPSVAGVITVDHSFWSGFQWFVDGQQVKPHGFPRNKLTLPGTDRPVEARVKGGFYSPFPKLVVDGVEHPCGPEVPRRLLITSWLPFLGLVVVQGFLGFLIAFVGVVVNVNVLRTERSDTGKLWLMLAVFLAVIAVDVALAIAVYSAFYS